MEEESGSRTRLIVGIIVVIVILIVGFFAVRGFFAKKSNPSQNIPGTNVTPTSVYYPNQQVITPTPSNTYNNGGMPLGSGGAGGSGGYYYNNSSSQENSQNNGSQSQSSGSQSQSQTLPNGMTQSQSQ